MGCRHASWRSLLDLDIDLALLQEAGKPPPDVVEKIEANPAIEVDTGFRETMVAGGEARFRTAIVKLSSRISTDWIEAKSPETAKPGDLVASWPGTLTAALVRPLSGEPVIAMSIYAPWMRTHSRAASRYIYADGSAHRVVSDLSVFISNRRRHRVLAAGDLNILRGHGEHGSAWWAARYKTVFDRMHVLGLPCVGPEYPNGRQADPWPKELPGHSRNVPTFHHSRQLPETATRQLDFVFASSDLTRSLTVRALNAPGEWGPSDHCRIEIELAEAR